MVAALAEQLLGRDQQALGWSGGTSLLVSPWGIPSPRTPLANPSITGGLPAPPFPPGPIAGGLCAPPR
jgi:hypothetical protein